MSAPRARATGLRRPASGIAIDTGQLARLRIGKGWNQSDLAREAGLSPSTISMIEKRERRPSAATLNALCTALGCTPTVLLPA